MKGLYTYFGVAVLLTIFAGCSDLPNIDQFFTFTVMRSLDFPVAQMEGGVTDTSITVTGRIDTAIDYTKKGTGTDLLRTSQVTRIQLTASDPSFNFGNLSNAWLLIGADTVGDSIYSMNGEYLLTPTGRDVTTLMQDTSYTAALHIALNNPIPNPVTITMILTFEYTALPR